MTINKILITISLFFILAACSNSNEQTFAERVKAREVAETQAALKSVEGLEFVDIKPGLERQIEAFTKPDQFGVVCYQSKSTSENLSCVKVQ